MFTALTMLSFGIGFRRCTTAAGALYFLASKVVSLRFFPLACLNFSYCVMKCVGDFSTSVQFYIVAGGIIYGRSIEPYNDLRDFTSPVGVGRMKFAEPYIVAFIQ